MRNSKGFTLIEALLILVIVGLLGGTGWYVWSARSSTDKSLNQAADTEITAASKKEESKLSNTNTEYLTVKEWSVKIPLNENVKGLSYKLKDFDYTNGKVADFRSTNLEQFKGDNCDNSVRVARGKAKEVVPNEIGSDEGGAFEDAYNEHQKNSSQTLTTRSISLKFGDYYFVPPGYAGASCAIDKANQDKETSAMLDIVKAINTMESAQ